MKVNTTFATLLVSFFFFRYMFQLFMLLNRIQIFNSYLLLFLNECIYRYVFQFLIITLTQTASFCLSFSASWVVVEDEYFLFSGVFGTSRSLALTCSHVWYSGGSCSVMVTNKANGLLGEQFMHDRNLATTSFVWADYPLHYTDQQFVENRLRIEWPQIHLWIPAFLLFFRNLKVSWVFSAIHAF